MSLKLLSCIGVVSKDSSVVQLKLVQEIYFENLLRPQRNNTLVMCIGLGKLVVDCINTILVDGCYKGHTLF